MQRENPSLKTKIEMAFQEYKITENSGLPETFCRNAFMTGAAAMAAIMETNITVNLQTFPRDGDGFCGLAGKP